METENKTSQNLQVLVAQHAMFKDLMQGEVDKVIVYMGKNTEIKATEPASSLQSWLCIADSNDTDAIVADLRA